MSDFTLSDEVEELRAAAAKLAEQSLAPAARESEAAGRWPDRVLAVLEGFSLGQLDLPESVGGVEAGVLTKVVVLEALAMGDAGGLFGADRPGPAAGAVVACGDAALAAEVVADEAATPLQVLDEVTQRVEWAAGWPTPRRVWTIDGDVLRLVEVNGDPLPTKALAFAASGGVSAELGATVGEWSCDGLAVRGRARLWAAAVAVGIAQASFDATIAYTTERIVFGKPVAHHQGNAFDLAAAATNLHGSRLAVRDAAESYDQGQRWAGFWATQAWLTAVDTAVAVTDLGIQLLGGHGFLLDHLAEKRFREARHLGLVFGGRDAAEADVAAAVLDVPDPVLG